MTKEINDEITAAVSSLPYYSVTYDDGTNNKSCEDDGNLHICVDKYRFVFYNGQFKGDSGNDGKSILKERDISYFTRLVEETISKKTNIAIISDRTMKYTYADLDTAARAIISLLNASILYQSHQVKYQVTVVRTDTFDEVFKSINKLRDMISKSVET